jgi:hypothetical protein
MATTVLTKKRRNFRTTKPAETLYFRQMYDENHKENLISQKDT